MNKQIRYQKQIRILGLLLSLIFTATLFVVMGSPVSACPMEACEIELANTTVTAGEDITFVVSILDGADNKEGWATYGTAGMPYEGCIFEIDPAAGGSWNLNTYTAENPGEWEVKAICTATIENEINTREDTITITVLPDEPTPRDAGAVGTPTGAIAGSIAQTALEEIK
ncbi:MAG: hypothetical protein JSV74_04445 [Dehalococcoidia bacterium]|nr:MAG: hypothetical protein JSV74_04445 [Dehalococcoidia bacterium]